MLSGGAQLSSLDGVNIHWVSLSSFTDSELGGVLVSCPGFGSMEG